jgi:hypothetical protein
MTEVLPLSAHSDLQFSANFFERHHSDVFMVANFVNPFNTSDIPMSATFLSSAYQSLVQTATFKSVSNLNMGATFIKPKSIINLPMSARFYVNSSTASLTSNAVFFQKSDLPLSASFIQTQRADFAMYATFGQHAVLPMSATFSIASTSDLRMKAFLGHFNAFLPMSATFIIPGHTDFKANIIIQSYQPPKGIHFSNQADFLAGITIAGLTTQDLQMFANFAGKNPNDFKATIEIINSYIGGGGVPVTLTGGAIPITVTTDSTGYFHIGNLQPGTYIVTPIMSGMAFNPSTYTITITNENVTLYFNADGSFKNETFIPVPLPPNPTGMCVVNPNTGAPGTFSIDGFVLTSDFISGKSIIVTASNEDDASAFRSGFSRNMGEGT